MRSLMELFFGVKSSKKGARKSNKVSDYGMPAIAKPLEGLMMECLQVQEPISVTYTWKIQGWSKIKESQIMSRRLSMGEYDFFIGTNPKGRNEFKNKSVSMFIQGIKTQLPTDKQIYIAVTLIMKDQLQGNHKSFKGICTPGKGVITGYASNFLPLKEFNDTSRGFLVNDTCIIEATLTFVGYCYDS